MTHVPVIVKGPAPLDTEEATVMVAIDVPEPGNITFAGLKETETPEGSIDVSKDTVPEKPFKAARLIAVVPEDPGSTVSEVGLADMLKSTGPLRSHTCSSGPK